MTPKLILLIVALVLLVAEAVGVKFGRVSAGWAGLACWALSTAV